MRQSSLLESSLRSLFLLSFAHALSLTRTPASIISDRSTALKCSGCSVSTKQLTMFPLGAISLMEAVTCKRSSFARTAGATHWESPANGQNVRFRTTNYSNEAELSAGADSRSSLPSRCESRCSQVSCVPGFHRLRLSLMLAGRDVKRASTMNYHITLGSKSKADRVFFLCSGVAVSVVAIVSPIVAMLVLALGAQPSRSLCIALLGAFALGAAVSYAASRSAARDPHELNAFRVGAYILAGSLMALPSFIVCWRLSGSNLSLLAALDGLICLVFLPALVVRATRGVGADSAPNIEGPTRGSSQ